MEDFKTPKEHGTNPNALTEAELDKLHANAKASGEIAKRASAAYVVDAQGLVLLSSEVKALRDPNTDRKSASH